MKVRTGNSLENLKDTRLSDDNLALEHRLDISASVYKRMKELGLSQKELAAKLGIGEAQVSRIIRAKQNLTIATLAKIENALDFDLGGGFRYKGKAAALLSVIYRPATLPRSWNQQDTWSDFISYSSEPVPCLKEVA